MKMTENTKQIILRSAFLLVGGIGNIETKFAYLTNRLGPVFPVTASIMSLIFLFKFGFWLYILSLFAFGVAFLPKWQNLLYKELSELSRKSSLGLWFKSLQQIKNFNKELQQARHDYHFKLTKANIELSKFGGSNIDKLLIINIKMEEELAADDIFSAENCWRFGILPEQFANLLIKIDVSRLLGQLNDEDFANRLADLSFASNYAVVQQVLARRQIEQAKTEHEQLIQKVLQVTNNSKKAVYVVETLLKNAEQWQIGLWDLNGSGIQGSPFVLVLRVILTNDNTASKLRTKLNLISKMTRVPVKIDTITSDTASVNLIFQLKSEQHGKLVSVRQVEKEARNNGSITLGVGDFGKVSLKLPRGDAATEVLIGGITRSGKSTLMTMLMVALASLTDSDGFRDYQDIYIGTIKDEDYAVLGWSKQGMVIEDNPKQIYKMLMYIDRVCTKRREVFKAAKVTNIKQYNRTRQDHKLGKILLVMDEYANMLSRAESEFVEVEGRKVRLSSAIEQLVVKLAQEHASRGLSIFVITQNFAKQALGRVFDAMGSKFLGYHDWNVWSSLDPSQEIAKSMRGQREQRTGLFYVNAPDFDATAETRFNMYRAGYFRIRTNYLDDDDLKNNFTLKFSTAKAYYSDVNSEDNLIEQPLPSAPIIKLT